MAWDYPVEWAAPTIDGDILAYGDPLVVGVATIATMEECTRGFRGLWGRDGRGVTTVAIEARIRVVRGISVVNFMGPPSDAPVLVPVEGVLRCFPVLSVWDVTLLSGVILSVLLLFV